MCHHPCTTTISWINVYLKLCSAPFWPLSTNFGICSISKYTAKDIPERICIDIDVRPTYEHHSVKIGDLLHCVKVCYLVWFYVGISCQVLFKCWEWWCVYKNTKLYINRPTTTIVSIRTHKTYLITNHVCNRELKTIVEWSLIELVMESGTEVTKPNQEHRGQGMQCYRSTLIMIIDSCFFLSLICASNSTIRAARTLWYCSWNWSLD